MPDLRQLRAAAIARLGDRVEADILLAHALGKPRSWLIAHADDAVDPAGASAFAALVERRAAGEPVAYLTGRRGFWTLELEVTPATLIPRPETELLVELALARLPQDGSPRVVDLGTGSGAVALAIARECPHARVLATDASAAALAVARRNAGTNQLRSVAFAESDWFDALTGERFDLIVSNPPYIAADDPHLGQGDLRFEPASALASGGDGLDDIRRIAGGARAHLAADGWLLFEHGWDQGAAARGLLEAAGYREIFTARDLEQRDRVSGGRAA
ncbi:peptide chain release factor N(5)-glutamine methyltransferase [Frateuria sp. STR12]|uniref:peptide chain release factor N(5)-glutamine methyltransferase n=1 Tax=Frateuria hangzhouensis TaxID=2995589 RepID=UPI00226089AC|nr:peptide chain release factor N(5)-glutamine methyltransferase [Frateuria sp. STR12]MCX7514051.1 peptide chain release factor N(5)-glutamine methyltransferase [Frateuria sp. STR12]